MAENFVFPMHDPMEVVRTKRFSARENAFFLKKPFAKRQKNTTLGAIGGSF
jgi:hypothetical protein